MLFGRKIEFMLTFIIHKGKTIWKDDTQIYFPIIQGFGYVDIWLAFMLFVLQHEIECQIFFDLGFRVLKMEKERHFITQEFPL